MSGVENRRATLALAAREKVKHLKMQTSPQGVCKIPVLQYGRIIGMLRLVSPSLRERTLEDVHRWVMWRNRNREAFFTWQEFTVERTLQWIESEYAQDAGDMMFFVETTEERPMGVLALSRLHDVAGECELGRVLWGEQEGASGVMPAAVKALCSFAAKELHICRVYLEVFESNVSAVLLYRKSGFLPVWRFELCQEKSPEGVRWILPTMRHDDGVKRMWALRMEWESQNGRILAEDGTE